MTSRRLLWVVAVAGALGCSMVFAPVVAAVAVPLLMGAVALCALDLAAGRTPGLNRSQVRRWMLLSLLIHAATGVVIQFSGLSAYLGPDAYQYNYAARELAAHWRGEQLMPFIPAGKEGYFYLLGGIYWTLGPFAVAGIMINAALAAGLVPILTAITGRLFGAASARFAPPLATLLPGLVLWPSQLLREASVFFFLALAVWCAVAFSRRTSLVGLVLLVGCLGTLFTLRGYVAAVFSFGLLAGIGFGRRQLVSGLGTSLSIGTLLLVVLLVLGFGYSGYRVVTESDLDSVSYLRRATAEEGASGFDAQTDISTPGRAITYLPFGLFQFVLGPLPWQAAGIRQLPALLDAVTWWILLPTVWRGVRNGLRQNRATWVLLLPAVALSLVLSLVIGNFGTVVRSRSQVMVLIVPVVAAGLATRRSGSGQRADQPSPAVRAV